MKVTYRLIKGLFILMAFLALPFLIEWVLNTSDLKHNPRTKPGAIITDGGAVKESLNRRAFNEIRFRSTGLRIYFMVNDMSDVQADALVSGMGGTVRVLQGGQEQSVFSFKLEQDFLPVDDALNFSEDLLSVLRIMPATLADHAAADKLAHRSFGLGEAVELAFVFEGDIPSGSRLLFSYSKCPRSLLHGTILERVFARLNVLSSDLNAK